MTGCYINGCKNASSNGVKMNFFPKDPVRKALWIKNCRMLGDTVRMPPNKHAALCEYHFAENMWEKQRVDGTKKLKCNAEPTIFGDLVVQIDKKIKDTPPKVDSHKTIVAHTSSDTKGIVISTPLMIKNEIKKYKILSISQPSVNKKPRLEVPKDPPKITSKPLPSTAKKTVSLILLNNNVISCYTEDVPSEAGSKSIDANISGSKSRLQNGTQELLKQDIKNESDSDTDSFIANNFEPVSDEEMDIANNFEPITDDEVDSDEEDDELLKDNDIVAEENQLHCLQTEFKSDLDQTDVSCRKCKWVEKVYQKSESIRLIMKKKFKNRHRLLKKKIKSLENKIKVLETNQRGIHNIFNGEQLDYLSSTVKKVSKWSDMTMEKANRYKFAFGIEGYQFLLDHNWPLPSLRTVRGRERKKNSGKANVKTTKNIE